MGNKVKSTMGLSGVLIAAIKVNATERDDLPKLLSGLQHLHADAFVMKQIFDLIDTYILLGNRSADWSVGDRFFEYFGVRDY